MRIIYPQKLNRGDTIRVIAPSCARSTVDLDVIKNAEVQFERLGLRVTWGKNIGETDIFECASIAARVADFHDAFTDPEVNGVFAVRRGWNANQLLQQIDWSLVRAHPKVFCGFSDITILQNAILSQAGVVSFSGPNFSSLGRAVPIEYTLEYMQKCLFAASAFSVRPSAHYFDAATLVPNPGWQVFSRGSAEGTIIGGNLCTLNLLHGTQYMPSIANSILFLEEDSESTYKTVDRDFQSLLHLPGFAEVKGLVWGRFQGATGMSADLLAEMIQRRPELQRISVLANVDFGHTDPKITFPIGGVARISAAADNPTIEIIEH